MKNDQDRLQGIWTISKMAMNGRALSPEMFAGARIAITGNRFSSTGMGAVYEGEMLFDEFAMPRQLDMKFDAGPEKGNINRGIYEMGRQSWRLCLATSGGRRPAQFSAPAGSGFVLQSFRRGGLPPDAAVKEKTVKRSPSSANAPGTALRTEFDGEWSMISAIMDGHAMDPSAVAWVKRITQGNETTVVAGPQVIMKMQFNFDASSSPGTIDYFNKTGANKGRVQHGIYKFENRLLTICVAPPGAARPAEFHSVPGDGRTLTAWKRNEPIAN